MASYDSYRELEFVLRSLDKGVIVTNSAGKIIYINKAVEALANPSSTKPIEQISHLQVSCHKANYNLKEYINFLIEQKEDSTEKKAEIKINGEFQSYYFQVYNSQKDGKRAVVLLSPSSSIKKMEEDQRLQKRLRLAEKLAVVGEMAAGTAHELKNPLSAIKGYLQFIQDESLDEPLRQKYLQVTMSEVSRLEGVLQEFLQLVKPSEAPLVSEKILLCENLSQGLKFMYPQLMKNNIELSFACKGYPVWVRGDYGKLKQVVINLIKNSIEAMSQTVSNPNKCLEIKLDLEFQDNVLQIYFQDTGPGIPEHLIDKLFSPFATTKASGTGLGLPVSMQIVKSMGGYLSAENTPKGACFYLEMPVMHFENKGFCMKETKICCKRILSDE